MQRATQGKDRCGKCGSETDPATGQGFPRPAVVVAGAVLRRVLPKAWPAGGLPSNYREYGAIYDILLVPDSTQATAMTLPIADAQAGEDPSDTALRSFPGVKAKRAAFASAVPMPSTGQTALVFFMPVDNDRESKDGTGVNLRRQKEALWAPLKKVYSSMRVLQQPHYTFTSTTKLLLAG